MGFPSPAQDHVEHRLILNSILMLNPANTIRIETPEGFVLVDRSITPSPGDTVAYQLEDYPQIGKLFPSGIITQDGETIDGQGLDGVVVLGKVMTEVLAVYQP